MGYLAAVHQRKRAVIGKIVMHERHRRKNMSTGIEMPANNDSCDPLYLSLEVHQSKRPLPCFIEEVSNFSGQELHIASGCLLKISFVALLANELTGIVVRLESELF